MNNADILTIHSGTPTTYSGLSIIKVLYNILPFMTDYGDIYTEVHMLY